MQAYTNQQREAVLEAQESRQEALGEALADIVEDYSLDLVRRGHASLVGRAWTLGEDSSRRDFCRFLEIHTAAVIGRLHQRGLL